MVGHSRSCPHDCDACKIRWHVELWRHGNGCIVCGKNRNHSFYACDICWDSLSSEDRIALKMAIREKEVP